MRMFKYVLVSILVIVLAVIVVLPWVDGYYIRKNYMKELAQIQQSIIKKNFKLELTNYRLGWLNSDVKLHLTKTNEIHPNAGFQIDQHINHGPLVHDATLGWAFLAAKINTTFESDPELLIVFTGVRMDNIQLHIETLLFFNQKIINRFNFSPFSIDIANANKKIDWQGFDAIMDVTGSNSYTVNATIKPLLIKMNGGADSFNVDNVTANTNTQCNGHNCSDVITFSSPRLSLLHAVNNSGIVVQNISTQLNFECQSARMCSGSMAFNAPNMELTAGNKKLNFTHFGFTFALEPSTVAGAINAKTKLSFNQFMMNDFVFGPFNIDLDVSNLNLLSLVKSMQALAKVNAVPANLALSREDYWLAVLKAGGYHIVTPDLRVDQNILLKTSYGDFNSSAKIFWPANLPLPVNADDFIHNINAEVDAHVSDQFVDQVIQKVAAEAEAINAAKKAQAAASAPLQHDVTKEIDDFKKQLQLYVTQQQLSSNAYTVIVAAVNANMSPVLFEVSLQQGLANKQLTPAVDVYVKTTFAKIATDRMNELNIMFETPVTDEDDLEKRINALVTKTYLTDATAKQIIGMQSQNLDSTIYTAFIKNLIVNGALPESVGIQLVRSYTQLKNGVSAGESSVESAADGLKKYFDSYVTKGYLVHDANGYSVSIVFSQDTLKLNGVVFQLPVAKPAMPIPTGVKAIHTPAGVMSVPTSSAPGVNGAVVPQQQSVPAAGANVVPPVLQKPSTVSLPSVTPTSSQSRPKVAPTQPSAKLPVPTQALTVPGP